MLDAPFIADNSAFHDQRDQGIGSDLRWEDTIISCNKVLWLNIDITFSIYFYFSMKDTSIFQQDFWKEPDKLKCLNIFLIMKFYHEKTFLKNNPLLENLPTKYILKLVFLKIISNNFIELLVNFHFDKKKKYYIHVYYFLLQSTEASWTKSVKL